MQIVRNSPSTLLLSPLHAPLDSASAIVTFRAVVFSLSSLACNIPLNMVTLSIRLSSFRLSSTTSLPSCTLHLSSTTRRLRAESPLVHPCPDRDVRSLIFPTDWSLRWTEHLPDRLAVRAAVIQIDVVKRSRSRFACAFRDSEVVLGTVRVNLLSLANGTVCQSLQVTDAQGLPIQFTLSFDAVVEESSRIKLHPTKVLLKANVPDAYLVLEYSPARSTSTSDEQSSENGEFQWEQLPALLIRAHSLTKLVHSRMKLRVMSGRRSSQIAEVTFPVHQVWAAFAHPYHPFPTTIHLTNDISVSLLLTSESPPPNGQMAGGVTTDGAITGARPVIFGTSLSDIGRVPPGPNIPRGWVRLVDTFGYSYFHNISSGVNVWTLPPDETTTAAVQSDQTRARECGFEPEKYGVFRGPNNECTWIHPAAHRISMPTYNGDVSTVLSTISLPQDESPRTSISLSTLDASELHPAAFNKRMKSLVDDTIPIEKRGQVVEMKWSLVPKQQWFHGSEATEGHSLTSVDEGKTVLRFGGSHGSGGARLNVLTSLNTETMQWRKINPSGVIPDARTGHGAVALGNDQSRLMIFGGSSPQGRRNDLHVFHVANETWSPVSYTGTPPGVRARMGMTVTTDGSVALVFGGRSLYRYLGGKYYDSLYINAFHAEREQWVQMSPRGNIKPKPRSGCSFEMINDRHAILFGGYDDGDKFYDETYIFDIVSSSWQLLPYPEDGVHPMARESHMSTMMGSHFLVYGGEAEKGLRSDLHVFDASKLRWTDQPTVVGHGPGRLCSGGLAAIDDSRAVLVGGDNGFSMSNSTYSLEVSHRSTIDARELKELARERGPDASACVVCMDAEVDTMFLWCGHSVCCRSCSKMVKTFCPVCRKPFSRIVHSKFDS